MLGSIINVIILNFLSTTIIFFAGLKMAFREGLKYTLKRKNEEIPESQPPTAKRIITEPVQIDPHVLAKSKPLKIAKFPDFDLNFSNSLNSTEENNISLPLESIANSFKTQMLEFYKESPKLKNLSFYLLDRIVARTKTMQKEFFEEKKAKEQRLLIEKENLISALKREQTS